LLMLQNDNEKLGNVQLKVKRLFIYCHLHDDDDDDDLHEHDQQRFTMRSGVLTGNDTRWCSTSNGSPLPERTDFGPRSLQL